MQCVHTQTREDTLDVVAEGGKGRIRYLNYFKCVNPQCTPNINVHIFPLNSQMCFTAAPSLDVQTEDLVQQQLVSGVPKVLMNFPG